MRNPNPTKARFPLPRPGTAVLAAAGAGGVLVVSVLAPNYLTKIGFVVVPLGLLVLLIVVALFVVPVATLPSVALVMFAVLPARILPQEGPLAALPVATIVLGIWVFRRMLLLHPPIARSLAAADSPARTAPSLAMAARACGVGFFLWSVFVLIRSVEVQTSAGWLISFTAGAILPMLVSDARREAALLRSTWIILGSVLGCYAIAEALLGRNPVWGTLFTVLGVTDSQHWSVYRAEASFGHPLIAALFFAVTGVLAITWWLTNRSRWPLAGAILNGLALIATVSRGPILATAVVIVLTYLVVIALRGSKRWSRVGLLAVLGAAGIAVLLSNEAFQQRSSSIEAAVSSQARDIGVWVAIQAANASDWLGTGPGTSGITGRLFDSVVIENSLLQLLISVGIPGVILFLGMIGFAVLYALRQRAVAPAAALAVFTACIASFNAIDALRPLHLLLGCLLLLALSSTSPTEPQYLRSTHHHGTASKPVQARRMPPAKADLR